jgi:acetyltransferase-like isoleucine patch superfamily enzyme
VHPTASVEEGASVGPGTKIWSHVQVRTGARVGANCILGRNSFVDVDVVVGDNVKVQNNSSLYEGVSLEDGVFIGPHVVFTNDKVPRAVNADGTLKSTADWVLGRTHVCRGAALGAGTVVVTGVTIGEWAMVGSGTVVTKSVPAHALVLGNPGRIVGWVSANGVRCDDQDAAIAATELEIRGDAADTSARPPDRGAPATGTTTTSGGSTS